MIWIIVAIVVVLALVLFGVVAFNRLRTADIGAQEALGGIDVQLTRRADLIPNLVNTVKGYAEHERGVFEEVTAARTGVTEAARSGSVEQRAAAEGRLDRALVDVMAVAEAYPDLKASANFQQLQSDLRDTEDKLSFARQYYNDAVRRLNELVRTIPWMFFAGMAGVEERTFYDAPDGQDTAPSVQF
ncbi:LemA family protein [Aeromicrobium duanguangcaii]|uniref:LemA family protein n=1 Tax=Aeromicrobium duanguangcaii TaxID=2968086 RepID=A0ABY5KAT6_9ACTN|nr:LemA family protein [Aeromicrobium duanguangcaii]MCD9155035.1 LemA family protein [Aeromicrobium duanguangcaii]MCL3839134.1 LemA family protein [Aeromicrobium duanguangcaii]UUI67561.1 LemA family protein [Aeromicrobium duanguangcaii]